MIFSIFLLKTLIAGTPENIDCGYTLEPPWRGGSNEYPQSMFAIKIGIPYIKVGYNGVQIAWTCFPDVVPKEY